MSHEDIIRAWKDEEYRMSLSEEERAQLPENPAGLIELMDAEMSLVGGGYGSDTSTYTVMGEQCCSGGCVPPSGSPTCTGTDDGNGNPCT